MCGRCREPLFDGHPVELTGTGDVRSCDQEDQHSVPVDFLGRLVWTFTGLWHRNSGRSPRKVEPLALARQASTEGRPDGSRFGIRTSRR